FRARDYPGSGAKRRSSAHGRNLSPGRSNESLKKFIFTPSLKNHVQLRVGHQGHTAAIRADKLHLEGIAGTLTREMKSFETDNVNVDITGYKELSAQEISVFLPSSEAHKKAKTSFVIVADVECTSPSDQLVVVATLREAHDM